MQAVLLAAGSSSRFYPFNGTHKSMVYLLGKPILAHAIDGLKSIGIKELILVVRDDGIVKDYFGDGKKFGVEINYVVINQPLGMGDALLQAKKHLKGDFIFLGGNHVNSNILVSKLLTNRKNTDAVVLINQRLNTWEYGVVKLVGQQVKGVVEKPKKGQEPSKFCLVSIYLLPINFLAVLEKTKVHQYNFEEALDEFTKIAKVAAVEIKEEIATLKYPWDLLNVKNMLLKKMKDYRGKNVKIAKSAEIIGEVSISSGVVIMEGARVKGPCYIGKNAVIGNNALLRGGVDIEEGAVVGAYMEVKNSLVMKNSTTHSGFIGDSVVGEACKIGAQFCTANVRIDRKTIHDSGRKFLGVIMGNNVHIGIKSSTMPGVIIGNNA
ncbi:NTP transferase domain-containing protein, partial [Candidatus Microgenomates bacterium]|nr:NTP transferase domain-containing protein [Candidatus Microgenomates bacterium]